MGLGQRKIVGFSVLGWTHFRTATTGDLLWIGDALEVGGTYLFALDEVANNGGIEYRLHDKAKWNVFEGEEMDDIVHALTLTRVCLNWPELVYDEENEFARIGICTTWARGDETQ